MKPLLLFDIDGTLVRGGNGKVSFRTALEGRFGTAGPIDAWDFSGKTDPQIARELLREAGLGDEEIDPGLADLWPPYLEGLARELEARPMTVLPGVEALLDGLSPLAARGEVGLGLVTGNLQVGAALKLRSVGLEGVFLVGDGPLGAFGSDHEDRVALPPVALERARGRLGHPFVAEGAVIIGDTPRDVACGRAHGMRTVAVATGRFSREHLEGTGADVVFDSLAVTDQVMDVLFR
jgi:phosphoglycolate phosphatase